MEYRKASTYFSLMKRKTNVHVMAEVKPYLWITTNKIYTNIQYEL